jgi:hypothetical protein
MQHSPSSASPANESGALLSGWISRADLARQLQVTEGTLRRWEAQRWGPPCVRAGRKIYYRRSAVLEWMEEREAAGHRRGRREARR